MSWCKVARAPCVCVCLSNFISHSDASGNSNFLVNAHSLLHNSVFLVTGSICVCTSHSECGAGSTPCFRV